LIYLILFDKLRTFDLQNQEVKMKNFSCFLILSSIILLQNTYSQPSWMYVEQSSGVTSSLNSASMFGNYQPSQVWICGDAGVVLKSSNQGSNWLNMSGNGIPANVNLVSISCKAIDTALTGGNIGTTAYVYRTVNGGLNWTQVFSQTNGKINAIWMRNASLGFMEGDPVGGRWSLWKTTNGGANWDSANVRLTQSGTENGFNNSLSIIYSNIWFGTNNSRLYHSTNNGMSWSSVTVPDVNSSALWIYWDTTMYTFVRFGGSNVYQTTNSGINWTQTACPDAGLFRGFCPGYYGVADQSPMATYALRGNNKVYFSNFGGPLIAEYTAPAGSYTHMAHDGYTAYWQYTWAVRTNGGITRISLFRGGAVRSISTEIPASFLLKQNFPNPFNPETMIRFDLPNMKSGTSGRNVLVSLKVFDILGKEVLLLVNETLYPGSYEVTFNAVNLPSGIYFYRLSAGDYTETKRMILIK
jgi:photosystem II stability/assembly factor-like uncharacterized protein